MKKLNAFPISALSIFLLLQGGCDRMNVSSTVISMKGDKWFIDNSIINKGSPAEGLLLNVRMVNSVFEDIGDKIPPDYKDFDPEKNTDEFISAIPDYVQCGINAFTIGLQGGMPGYEGAVNSAFNADGSLRDVYMSRVARVIKAADQNSAVIILSCFYQRQHSHFNALNGREAILNALTNTVKWLQENEFQNVILEVANEYRHGGYRNWKDGKWLISTRGQLELMNLAKGLNPDLIVGTSGMGDGQLNDSLAQAADYISLHFNNTSLEDYEKKISSVKKYGKPVLCNEDDKIGQAGASALAFSVSGGAGWGFMHSRQNQSIPFRFEGHMDDTLTYNMFRKVSRKGYLIDRNALLEPSVIITYPNDGDIFETGQPVTIRFSYISPDTARGKVIKLYSNDIEAGTVNPGQKQLRITPDASGIHYLTIVVTDEKGNVFLRSPAVDIIVRD